MIPRILRNSSSALTFVEVFFVNLRDKVTVRIDRHNLVFTIPRRIVKDIERRFSVGVI